MLVVSRAPLVVAAGFARVAVRRAAINVAARTQLVLARVTVEVGAARADGVELRDARGSLVRPIGASRARVARRRARYVAILHAGGTSTTHAKASARGKGASRACNLRATTRGSVKARICQLTIAFAGEIGGVRVGSREAGQRCASALAAEEAARASLTLLLAFHILVFASRAM